MQAKQRGFTFVELMVTIAIAAILMVMAAPSFSSFIVKMRVDSTAKQLFSDLSMARVEAVKRNYRVLVCPSPTTGSISNCASTNNWSQGWLVCVDATAAANCNNTAIAVAANDPNPFTIRSALPGSISVTGTLNPIVFRPDGSAAAASLTITSGTASKTVSVAASGSISQN